MRKTEACGLSTSLTGFGSGFARGPFFTRVACDPGALAPWHADADTETSVVFGDGPARVQWDAAISNGFDFAQQDHRQRLVELMEP